MFKTHYDHLQKPLFSQLDALSKKRRKQLESSWAGVFYQEFFYRLDEKLFEGLYSKKYSRPNVPVNVLVAFETLKASFGYSDLQMFEAFSFDMQVRYAMGYHNLGEGDFELRTVYNFRQRLSQHMQETGVNLIEKCFEQITDEQIETYEIKSGRQRMDSTQVSSNIRWMSRLQLLVEVLQRAHRMLDAEDQERFAETFDPYLQGHARQYVYHLKGKDTKAHVQRIGETINRLLDQLDDKYGQEAAYTVLERVFCEHFRVGENAVQITPNEELSAGSMQSPDDLEATYRKKGGKSYKGYVANIAETCDPENNLQLITKVQVAANKTDDAHLMTAAIPGLKERTDLDTLYTDGGYGSLDADQTLSDNRIKLIQTAIRGRKPSSERFSLADFEFSTRPDGTPLEITCPNSQIVPVLPGRKAHRFFARFDPEFCKSCPDHHRCPTHPRKRDPYRRLLFSQKDVLVAIRRRTFEDYKETGRNLRAAVEATIRLVKKPFPSGKLPVRSLFRVYNMITASAAMVNVRRIRRYLETKTKEVMTDSIFRENVQELCAFCSNFLVFVRSWFYFLIFDSRFPDFVFSF